MTNSLARFAFSGVPTFFRAQCSIASQGHGYDGAGRELSRHLERLVPYDVENDDWLYAIGKLERAVADSNDDEVVNWFLDYFPQCMALVPTRRRKTFLRGVYDQMGCE